MIIGFMFGFVIGALFGIITAALCVAAKDEDDLMK